MIFQTDLTVWQRIWNSRRQKKVELEYFTPQAL